MDASKHIFSQFFFRSQGGTTGKNPDFGRFQKDNTFSKYAQEISQYWNFATKKQKEILR